MFKSLQSLARWLPALLVMLLIFLFSARTSADLPNFDWADRAVKKGGHIMGYAMLAWSYWRAFDFRSDKRWLAWLLTVLYAVSDEWHQSLVPSRHPSLWDVLIFDNLGALISLWLTNRYKTKTIRPNLPDRITEPSAKS
ncbi:MAG: VanZ family protein [Anaerolineales bacterium]